MKDQNLLDIWRIRHPDEYRFTWYKNKPIVKERLDFFLISADLSTRVLISDIDPRFCSDHAIPLIEVDFGECCRGPGFWKLNCSLLECKGYQEDIINMIKKHSLEISEIMLRWEIIKMDVRGNTFKTGVRKKRADKNKLEVLERKLYQLQKEVDKKEVPYLQDHDKQIELISKDIEEIIQKKARYASEINQAIWMHQGEKNSSYFFNLEKNKTRISIPKLLIKKAGKEILVEKQTEVLAEPRNYYANLFKKYDTNWPEEYESNMNIPKLSEEQKQVLDEPLTLAEVEIAIRQLAQGRCPGIDGISIEWYLKFIDEIKYILHSLFLKWIQEGEMNQSARQGIISLLEKPQKDLLRIKHWRPLTLLCCDHKIFAKIIANRIELVIDDLIHEDQTGFIKGRSCAQNLMELNTVLSIIEKENSESVLIAIDFSKAYDTISFEALEKMLQMFNFGKEIISWIMLCHRNLTSKVLNNGEFSEDITIGRGLRQGSPLSCLLFDLVIEILAIRIRKNQDIEGIDIGQKTKKMGQYADDLWLSLKHKRKTYTALMQELRLFECFTGLKVNYDKTEILRLGSLRHSNAEMYTEFPIQWSESTIKILGILICQDESLRAKINYQEIIQQESQVASCRAVFFLVLSNFWCICCST